MNDKKLEGLRSINIMVSQSMHSDAKKRSSDYRLSLSEYLRWLIDDDLKNQRIDFTIKK